MSGIPTNHRDIARYLTTADPTVAAAAIEKLQAEAHAWRTLVEQARAVPDGLVKCADVLASHELVEGRIVVLATKGGE